MTACGLSCLQERVFGATTWSRLQRQDVGVRSNRLKQSGQRHDILFCWPKTYNDASRVDLAVRHEVVLFDVFKVGRFLERRVVPIEVPLPPVQVGEIVPDRAEVALEVVVVDGIETNDGRERADIDFGELIADEVVFALEHLFESLQALEQGVNGVFVSLRLAGETALVHAVVDRVVDPCVGLVNLFAKRLGVKIDLGQLFGDVVVELGVELSYRVSPASKSHRDPTYHPQDLARFVVYDLVCLFVKQNRHSEAERVVRVDLEVKLADLFLR